MVRIIIDNLKRKNKILFVAPLYKDRSPSQRFRFEQYIEFLEENNWECHYSSLITPETDKLFYSKGNSLKKMILVMKFFYKRLKDVINSNNYDIIYVQREACFIGITIFEKYFAKKSKLIFDFDDSIWLPNVSNANKKFDWLKNANKIKKIISYSSVVFAGNEYLKQFALNYNNNVEIIPTTIDTEEYKRIKTENKKIIIGWSGSITTIQHFEYALNFLKRIKGKYKEKIEIKVIGDANYNNKELNVNGIAWSKETEIVDLSSFDIGIMPLPNDEWAKGKCGLKGLQYMALEIATIMSPVGVNTEIIKDGKNGFLADTESEWFEKLSLLIENKGLREKLGKIGRKTVLDKYSVDANKNKYLDIFNSLVSS